MAKQKAQSEFSGKAFEKQSDSFGGSLLNGNSAKIARPLESKLPIHLTLRSNKGVMRLPKNLLRVKEILVTTNKKHGVKIYSHSNVGNHLHMVIKIPRRSSWSAYIRELMGKLAHRLQDLGGRKSAAGKFWKHRPHTRIVRGWRKAFWAVLDYLYLNDLEAEGFISRKQTKTLKDLRAIFDG